MNRLRHLLVWLVVTASLSSTLLVDRGPAWFTRAVAVQPRERIPGQVMASVAIPGRKARRARQVPGEDLIRTLYEEHGRSLLAYAVRLTNDRAAAEDVVQETLLRAWKHADDLEHGIGSIRGWLLTVARNIITDRARARAVRPTEVNQPVDVPTPARDHADDVVDTITVLGAIEHLSPEHRAVIVELYYRGRTVNETAAALQIAPGTVKSRTYHAVRALRATLGATAKGGAR
jgi:RNA polymerase sigma-70 factor, ECF subfamily